VKKAVGSIALAIILSGCGGGAGGSSIPPSQPPALPISVTLSPDSQQTIDQGQSVSFTASVTNDTSGQGVSWRLSGSGCSGSACGALTGTTPTTAAYNAPASVPSTFNVSVIATSVKDASVSASTVVVVNPAPAITTTTLQDGRVGTPYVVTLQASGGTGVLSWSLASGSLPSGLTLDADTGTISGTPTSQGAGTSNFKVQVIDSAETPVSAQQPLSLTIENPSLAITTTSLPDGTLGVAYSATLEEDYGVLPVSWSVTAGTLPNGLTLNQTTGLIHGTPSATGIFNFTVTVTDSSTPARNASQPLSIKINPGGAANALLDGHYAFLLSGYDSGGEPVAVAGSFAADGSGSISNGVEDVISFASGSASGLTFSGAYSVGADQRGTITITNSQTNSYTMAMALGAVSSGVATKGSILEFDSSGYTMSGVIDKQDSSAFSQSALNGNYAFSFTGWDSTANRLGIVGEFTTSAGGIPSGLLDLNDFGTSESQLSFTGAFTSGVDATNGRAVGTLASVSPAPTLYAFYVVSAAKWLAISLNPAASSGLVTGEVEAQSGGPFGPGSLDGTSVMSVESIASSGASGGSRVTLGLATFDGSGNVSFSLDDNNAGTLSTLNPSGTNTPPDSTTGRFTMTQGSVDWVGYLFNTNQGFILGSDVSVAAGVFEPQSLGTFANSSLNGSFFFGAEPFAAPPVPPPLGGPTASLSEGVLTSDGNQNLSGTKDLNQMGSLVANQAIGDTYSVSTNGRVTVGSNSLILYIVSPMKFFSISTSANDPNPTRGFGQQ
jgi:Putative Ig domain